MPKKLDASRAAALDISKTSYINDEGAVPLRL